MVSGHLPTFFSKPDKNFKIYTNVYNLKNIESLRKKVAIWPQATFSTNFMKKGDKNEQVSCTGI